MTDKNKTQPFLGDAPDTPSASIGSDRTLPYPQFASSQVERSRLSFDQTVSMLPSFPDMNRDGLRPLLGGILKDNNIVLDGTLTVKLAYEDFDSLVYLSKNSIVFQDSAPPSGEPSPSEFVCSILLDSGQIGRVSIYTNQAGFVVALNCTEEQYKTARKSQE